MQILCVRGLWWLGFFFFFVAFLFVSRYGIDRVFENRTNHTLIYNMGASATQVSILASTSYKSKDRGRKLTVGTATVVGKGWNQFLGAGAFTDRLIEYLADVVNAEHLSAKGQDVRTMVRPMAKLRKGADKVKEVLSANEDFVLFIESLTRDLDFRTVVERSTLEEVAADLIEAVAQPVHDALAAAKLTLDDIDAVEVVGGGVRIPAVQAQLRKLFAPYVHTAFALCGGRIAL